MDSVWLRVIQVNDVYELENFPHFKTLVDRMQEGPDRTLIVLSGDFLAPSLLSSLDKGHGMVDVMGKCGFTHVCFGNHETDVPPTALRQRIAQSNFVWLNTNMRELDEKVGCHTVVDDVIEVKHGAIVKKVALIGLLANDPGLYRPGSFAGSKIAPVFETAEDYLKEKASADIDLIIPLTHQNMSEDRLFANAFTGERFPVILGGHDHEPYDETHLGARIIKTGMDCHNTAIVDIKWPIDRQVVSNEACIEAEIVPTTTFAADSNVRACVDAHERVLLELENAKLFRPGNWITDKNEPFSTKDNRTGFSTGSQALVSMLRMGMRAECCILNAGSIRAGKVYGNDEWFTWGDLKAEIPFPTDMTVMNLPGKVLETTIANSRQGARQEPPVSSGGYLITCNQLQWNNASFTIDAIGGKPFDPERTYLTTLPIKFFAGIDNHVALLEWAKDVPCCRTLDSEAGRPAKLVIVEVFSSLIWLKMGAFEDIDTNGDGVLSRSEVKARAIELYGRDVADLMVDNIMGVADVDNDGTISPLEMMVVQFVASDMLRHVCTNEEFSVMRKIVLEVLGNRPSCEQVNQVMLHLHQVLDLSGDGKIHREEAMAVLGDLKNQHLLR